MARKRFSLAWLKPPPVPPDGVMSLSDHLRELRYRLVAAIVSIILGMIVMAFFYQPLYALLLQPWSTAVEALRVSRPDISTSVVNIGIVAPFALAMRVTAAAGIVLSSPFWLYQVWAFVMPGLKQNEKKAALLFIGAAVPLFLAGIVVGYLILPQGIAVMLTFTPDSVEVTNMLDINSFLVMLLQLMLASGVAFLLPVFLVGLNLAGVVKGASLGKFRAYAVFGCFVFGAVVTPSTDPFSMSAIAVPMAVLYIAAEVVCRSLDKRKAKRLAESDLLVEL
ncbi:twin-arginine translocase subunit TatC [Propionicicella superfundia]|uniref:twin-arginine translocase subunit TatC n=1 Tax=Propionicicella superfundia TaxID=348582 RepID=UPI0004073638|nr:twin-arginine translocase subunit TatC [Propionicicella superfundia]